MIQRTFMAGARRRGRMASPTDNHERWLLTYADLITLLLALFVVMYSMSRVDRDRFDAMSRALSGVLKSHSQEVVLGGAMNTGDLRLARNRIVYKMAETIDSTVSTKVTVRGLIIQIREGALFTTSEAELTDGARSVLRTVGSELRRLSNQIRIEGHTDSQPIHTPRFPSNWELSTARATSVLRYLIDSSGLDPARISAIGYGEHRPMVLNDSPENMAVNRRVDIVVLTEEWGRGEPEAAVEDLSKAPTAALE